MMKIAIRFLKILRFIPIYLREMTVSNVRVAIDAFRPKPKFDPGFLEISLQGYNDFQRWAAVCLISMTPGSLSVDMEHGSHTLLLHVLYKDDPVETKRQIERLIRKACGKPSHES